MLLTSLLPESAVKKPVAFPLPDISSSLETSDRDFYIKLQFLRKRLQKRQLLKVRLHSEKLGRTRATLLRRLSFPFLQSKNDNDVEMDTPAKETASYNCALCQIHNPQPLIKIWKTGKHCSCTANGDVCDDEIRSVTTKLAEEIKTYNVSGQEISDSVQTIYNSVDRRLQHAVWKGDITEEMAVERMNSFEKELMRNLHRKLFNKVLEEEEKTDQNLNHKINRLHWVTAQHLAAKLNESDDETTELLQRAMLDIASINFKESPGEKLESIMSCSKHIFALLRRCPDSSESADDYLPVLVYIILQVNPPWLHSNIKYILLFSNSDRVVKGEEGYYFTHLCSVVYYIESISADSLNMSEETFQSYFSSCLSKENMQISVNDSLAGSVCKVYNQAAEAKALRNKQDCLQERSVNLKAQMKIIKADILSESTRSKLSKAEVSKFMASRLERSRSNRTSFVSQLPGRITATEVSQDTFINNFNPLKSQINILGSHNHVNDSENYSNKRKNLNDYCDLIIPGTKSAAGLKIPQTIVANDQIHIFVQKNLLNDSVDVAYDDESYLIINDLKER